MISPDRSTTSKEGKGGLYNTNKLAQELSSRQEVVVVVSRNVGLKTNSKD